MKPKNGNWYGIRSGQVVKSTRYPIPAHQYHTTFECV